MSARTCVPVLGCLSLMLGASPSSADDAAAVAKVAATIRDPKATDADREAALKSHPTLAVEIVRELAKGLDGKGTAEEYRLIPWIWRPSIAAGRRNDADELRRLLDLSLPKEGEPLGHWQAVVIGGGVINGVSDHAYPRARIESDVLSGDANAGLRKRWTHAINQAFEMADDESVNTGTRYDALRMIAMDAWVKAGPSLLRYVGKDAHPELQMGAVSGLADVPEQEAAQGLIAAMPGLTAENRVLAINGLLRDDARKAKLRDALATGHVKREWLSDEQTKRLGEK